MSRRGDDEATFETSDGRNYVLSVTDTAPARAQCGLAALRLPHQTWRRLGGKVKFSDDAALSELWDYSKKRKKVLQAPNDRGGFAWPPVFEDPSRPLVIDAGCGFGALAVNLAKTRPHVNVLAVDRAAHCLLYGSGLADRLEMTGRLRFACAPRAPAAVPGRRWLCDDVLLGHGSRGAAARRGGGCRSRPSPRRSSRSVRSRSSRRYRASWRWSRKSTADRRRAASRCGRKNAA